MSEKTRSDFEAWAASLGLCTEQRQGMYWFDNLETAWHCWLSSRRQALEEAAEIAESRIVADKEAELKARAAEAKGKGEKEELAALHYWLGVSAHNASHRNLASAIRREADPK